MDIEYQHFIAGGGLGGLLSAALIAKRGEKVFLAERLPFLGGRFTSHKYRGFEIPTGAVHTIPHSQKGPLGKILLQDLNLPIQVQNVEDFTAWYWPNRKPIKHRSFWGIFKAFPKVSQRLFVIRKLLLDIRKSEHYTESFHDYLMTSTSDPQIFQFFNAVTGFALSLNISQISTASMFRVLRRLYQRGRPGIPTGGCKAVINTLVNFIDQFNGQRLTKNCKLMKVELDDNKIRTAVCRNLLTNEEFEVHAQNYIFNLGPSQTNEILTKSKLPFKLSHKPIAQGGGFAYRSKVSILGSSAVAQFPENEYVKGAIEPTILSPNLAPEGEHLLLTHHVFNSTDIVRDCRKARDELLATLPLLREEDELCLHTYQKEWPVNYASQGNDLSNFHPEIKNLYFVGDGYKGNQGWMMTEGIAYGVEQVVNSLFSNKDK